MCQIVWACNFSFSIIHPLTRDQLYTDCTVLRFFLQVLLNVLAGMSVDKSGTSWDQCVNFFFNFALRPRKPWGSFGRTAQDVHLDSHTALELWMLRSFSVALHIYTATDQRDYWGRGAHLNFYTAPELWIIAAVSKYVNMVLNVHRNHKAY